MAFTPLNALSTFIAVARHRSFAGAARDLGVSTSALSQSVRQLEARLGITLLARTSRTVALTDAGQRLLEHSGPAVDQALESLKTVSARPGEITGRVRLTIPTMAAPLIVARLLPRFVERGVPQKPQDLLHHDCICVRPSRSSPRYAWELERGAKTWRVPVQGPVTTNDPELMRLLGVAGVGLFYAFEPVIADDVRSERLQIVLEPYAASVPGFFLYFPSRAQVSPALRAFVDVARELAGPSNRHAAVKPS